MKYENKRKTESMIIRLTEIKKSLGEMILEEENLSYEIVSLRNHVMGLLDRFVTFSKKAERSSLPFYGLRIQCVRVVEYDSAKEGKSFSVTYSAINRAGNHEMTNLVITASDAVYTQPIKGENIYSSSVLRRELARLSKSLADTAENKSALLITSQLCDIWESQEIEELKR